MAVGDGTRDVVNDPLALNPLQRGADRSLPTYGIRNPGLSAGDAATKQGMRALDVIEGLQATAGKIFESQANEALTNGKISFMQGAAEADIAATGNKYTMQGYQAMKSVNDAQTWFANEANYISQEDGAGMDPKDYAIRLQKSMKETFANLPADPKVRESFLAAYDSYGPRLAAMQVEQHNKYNEDRSASEFTNLLTGGSNVNPDSSTSVMGGTFRVNPEQVSKAIQYTPDDRDTAIRTMLGEAGGEGANGMAAVAHVLVNRTSDSRYAGSVSKVALEPKQFSTWNTGEGGNNPLRWDQNSETYKRAGAIWDAVASGHSVDPTGGATHYYNAAEVTPDWAADEQVKAGGEIRIGNHTFLGNPGTIGSTAATAFLKSRSNKGPESIDGLNKDFQGGLSGMIQASPFGKDLGIYSGYRTPEHQAELYQAALKKYGSEAEARKWVAPPGKSEHNSGNAVDLSYKGQSLEKAPQEVKDWVKQNAAQFGLAVPLDNEPWHVELAGVRGGDKSTNDANIGEAVSARPSTGNGTQTQRIIDSSPLPGPRKAAALADAIRRQFAADDDTLFNDSGGIAKMYALGAKASDIDEVLRAKQQFEDRKDKKFDLNFEKERATVLSNVAGGVYPTVDDAMNAVDALHSKYNVGEAESKSLARAVADKWGQARDTVIPLELRSFAATLHDGIQSKRITPEEAGQQIIDFGKKSGVKEAVINNFVSDMYSTAQSERDKDRTRAQAELDKQVKEQAVINQANGAIVRGAGLKGLGGQVRVPDPDNPGQSKEISGEEYGVYAIKKRTQDDYNQQVASGTIDKNKAQTSYYHDVYSNLNKQGVYDKEFGRQLSAAITSPIIGPDKKVTDGAQQALSVYMQLRDDPSIGSSYLAGMIEDDKARTFLETAAQQYDQRHDLSPALMAADSILSQKLTPTEKLEKTADYMTKRSAAVTNSIEELTNRSSFWDKFFSDGTYNSDDLKTVREANKEPMSNYISIAADIYHLRNPTEPLGVSIQKAQDDLTRNSVIVGKNVIIGDETKGTRLDQVMGLTQQGKDAPNKALDTYLKTEGPSAWRDLWTSQKSTVGETNMFGGLSRINQTVPEYRVTYIPTSNTLEVQLFKDQTQTETVGKALYLDPKTLGDWYKHKIGTGQGPAINKPWREFIDQAADFNQSPAGKQVQNSQNDAINDMFK
jgi:spore germination cell wall hydrolase CwlJ-like protein